MPMYYVNNNEQSNGDHEVHEFNCAWIPEEENRTYLGNYTNCRDAVMQAKKHYPNSNGCFYCSKACHTG